MKSRIVVIGAGIGGLTAGALLAQAGHEVTILEGHTYPGGSAGTFYHKGYRFDAGATVAGGFQDQGPHTLLGQQLGIIWPVQSSEPAWDVHIADRVIRLDSDNRDVLNQFPYSKPFWEKQARIADTSWKMAADGLPWPPSGLVEWSQLIRTGMRNFPNDLDLLPFLFTNVYQWMANYRLTKDTTFVRLIDAQLIISAQTTSQTGNALYGAVALDLPRKGVYEVEGGMGELSQVLAHRLADFGGRVLYRNRVTAIKVKNGRATGVYVQVGKHDTKRTFIPCDFLIANLTPWSLNQLLTGDSPVVLQKETRNRAKGSGAFVIYLGVDRAVLLKSITGHHQIITTIQGPLGEGKSIFMSVSPDWDTTRAPNGHRAVTITTHTNIQNWWDIAQTSAYEERKEAYVDLILETIERHLPGFRRSITLVMSGTPVTYEYFTSRYLGMVGGFPQTSLLNARGPQTGLSNIRLVGDSIFPGQSTAGVITGGMRVARDVDRRLKPHIATRFISRHTAGRTAS